MKHKEIEELLIDDAKKNKGGFLGLLAGLAAPLIGKLFGHGLHGDGLHIQGGVSQEQGIKNRINTVKYLGKLLGKYGPKFIGMGKGKKKGGYDVGGLQLGGYKVGGKKAKKPVNERAKLLGEYVRKSGKSLKDAMVKFKGKDVSDIRRALGKKGGKTAKRAKTAKRGKRGGEVETMVRRLLDEVE